MKPIRTANTTRAYPAVAKRNRPSEAKLLDRLSPALRSRQYSRRTEQRSCHWVKRYILFHKVRHAAEMAESEINAFLTHLAVKDADAPCLAPDASSSPDRR